ncbi:MAG: hypothetical protein HOM63_13975 [Kordiimonadaceae bacterium]|nr:hypothetical protein [Kordiimonadaceae bacterium]
MRDINKSLAFLASMLFSIITLYIYYDQYWYPPDDGAYAHVADRILSGDVLNRDVHDVHMGYINFINAAALKIFGNQMVSMRIPLVLTGIIQAALLFKLFSPKGYIRGSLAVLSITSLSYIQFANPTANWYGLFLTIVIISWLEWVSPSHRARIIGVGFLLITLFLFRQLSGVISALGVVSYLLFEARQNIAFKNSLVSKGIFLIMLAGLSGYLILKTPISAVIMFGIWPLAILLIGILKISVDDRTALIMVRDLLIGGIIAAAPITFYHIYHGSLASWYNDTVISALMLTDLNFIQSSSFFDYIFYCLYSMFKTPSIDIILNGILWISLILAASALGVGVLWQIYKKKQISPIVMIAVFYALVTVHFQIPIYLFYTVGITFCAILWILNTDSGTKTNGILSLIGIVSILALFYHADQPTGRQIIDILGGKKTSSQKVLLAGNVNLWVEEKDTLKYKEILQLVEQNVAENEGIFAFPSNSEIYYITGRSNQFGFFNSAFGINNQQQFDTVISSLKSSPPRLIFYTADDKYNTNRSKALIQIIKQNYSLLNTVDDIEVYLKD